MKRKKIIFLIRFWKYFNENWEDFILSYPEHLEQFKVQVDLEKNINKDNWI